MTKKSAYSVFAAFPLLDMLFQLRPVGHWSLILHAAICGAAIYYVVKNLKPFGLWNVLMTILAVVYNPFRPFEFNSVGWIITDIIALTLFYLLALRTPLPDNGGVRKYASEDDYNATHK